MKTLFSAVVIFLIGISCSAQKLYIRAFGRPTDKPLIFLHGGPGYNSALFEATTAAKLASGGYYVIVYDRRGEGRSVDTSAAFTFQQSFDDINSIYQQYHFRKAVIIAHSFGGMLGVLYAHKYPGHVSSLILVSALISPQASFKNILARVEAINKTRGDSSRMKYLEVVKKMDTGSIEYTSACFTLAIQNGFYSPKQITTEARAIYAALSRDSLLRYFSQMTFPPTTGFSEHEHYTLINLDKQIKNLSKKKVPTFALYGNDDGLFSIEQVTTLSNILGSINVKYVENCSHNVFIDQQQAFLDFIKLHSSE